MLNDGFQYLEQRDTENNITHEGVVGKYSAFATSDNKGIFDIVAEDLRALYDDMSSLGLAKLKADVQAMYDDMRNNPEFGSTAATAQAQKAVEAAGKAEAAYNNAKATAESIEAAVDEINQIPATLAQVQSLVIQAQDAQAAAATSATNAADSATAAANSAQGIADAEARAKAWAESSTSPDGAADADSATGKTQSARTWALAAGADAKAVAANTKTTADNAAKAQAIVDNATKAIQAAASGDWNITAAKAKADADGNTIGTTYLKRSGGTMTGALNLANNIWNAVGDDAALGGHNRAGHICIKGLNAPTGLAMYKQGSDSGGDAAHIIYNGSTINIDKRLTGLAAQFFIDADGYLAYRDAL